MGLDKRPPLPAPTDISSADQSSAIGPISDFATDISTRTDKTSFSIPEDGSPVTITTKKIRSEKEQSQTSLLIEYFEAGKAGEKVHSRPSVRVRVTPSSSKRSKKAHDHIQITETNKDRKPSYTRRISLPGRSSREVIEGTEISSHSEASSGRPPVEVEVLQNVSDLSRPELSPTRFVPLPSEISSIPADSLLEGEPVFHSPKKRRSQSFERGLEEATAAAAAGAVGATVMDRLKAPARQRSRSLSQERISHKAAEKLQRESTSRSRVANGKGKDLGSRSRSVSKEYIIDDEATTTKTRSSKRRDENRLSAPESFQQSEISALSGKSDRSVRSGTSTTSINNPKLLGIVEDTIKRLILPELNALREEQTAQKKRLTYEEITRDSRAPVASREDLRRLSKTSSLPSVKRSGTSTDDRGLVQTGDSTKSRRSRRSSRESTSDRSLETAVRDESSHSRRRSSGEKRRSHGKEAALAAGAAAAALGLTAANLKHHDSISSFDDKRERRKKRSKSKSRSRTTSISERVEEVRKRELVPPLPMQSMMESDITRDSILSADTERPPSRGSVSEQTPVRELREVNRGSPRHVISPSPLTPTRDRTPLSFRETTYRENRSPNVRSPPHESISSKAKAAGLAAAGLAAGTALGATVNHGKDQDEYERQEYEQVTPTRELSPVQSDSSLRPGQAEPLEHDRVRSIKSGNSLRSARKSDRMRSPQYDRSVPTSPNAYASKHRPKGISLEKPYEVLPEGEYAAETPVQSDVEDWLEREHEENEQYRSEISQLEPSEMERGRMSNYSEVSAADEYHDDVGDERHVTIINNRPQYVHTPAAVESAVASLHDPSTLSVHSSPRHSQLHMTEDIKETEAPLLERETLREGTIQGVGVQRQPTTKERWEQIRDRAIASTNKYQEGGVIEGSPRRSETRSIDMLPKMGASAIPQPGDDMPEIGHGLDDESEMTTNPSIIQGPIGGLEHEDRSHWPYEETPDPGTARDRKVHSAGHNAALLGTAAAAAGAAIGLGVANARGKEAEPRQQEYDSPTREYQPHVEEEWQSASREFDPSQEPYPEQMYTPSPAGLKDEGYQSAAQPSGLSPEPLRQSRLIDEASLDQYDDEIVGDDPFMTQKHLRHESGLSHGMESPLYDAATGKGIDRIQSRDIVALMDHLTVRDAQRNARDTEILVTLVRSAAEMRNSFEEMKNFLTEQHKIIMQNSDRNADLTTQRVLGGPRPFPTKASTRVAHSQTSEEDELPQKRKNILRRALKGLSSRNSNELGKIEGMLMQLLSEVEGLKDGQGIIRAPNSQTAGSINSYENLRNAQDPGYEPEGQAGTSSTPNQSGYLSNSSSRHLNGTMHSGYERRGSDGHRISTVLEEDLEDNQEPHMSPAERGYQEDERMLTPSQELRPRPLNQLSTSAAAGQTPPRFQDGFHSMSTDETPRTDKSRKHKSNTSSIFSAFKGGVSRWSKTTASTMPDSAPTSAGRKDGRPMSAASRSGSNINLNGEYDDDYELHDDDRIRSQRSLVDQQYTGSQHTRSPSPLIPDEEIEMDDPKYQAHRNSLNLQHPQPRAGPTHRHQTYLESQAINFEQPPTPETDQWGSAPALAINRNRFSGASTQTGGNLSPVYSDGGYSAHSASEQATGPLRAPKARDDGPLVPPKEPLPTTTYERIRPAPTGTVTSASGHQTFPYGSPMLDPAVHIPSPLEPIQEVRYSLETDRNSDVRQQATPSPRPTATMQSARRKITGPREMPPSTRSPSGGGGGLRRKPVGAAAGGSPSGEFFGV